MPERGGNRHRNGDNIMIDEKLDGVVENEFTGLWDDTDVSDVEQVAQNITIRLKLIYGEWFLNTQLGVPWFDKVFVKNPDLSAIDIIIKSVIAETPEVTGIVQYASQINRATRHLVISFQATTIYSENVVIENMEL
jgi:hypothetical protein